MNILFRVEATKELGLGHLTRCVVLAEKFSELYKDVDIFFITASNSVKKTAINHGFKVICLPFTHDNSDELRYYGSKLCGSICVTDIPNIPENYLKALKMKDCLVVSLDDESDTMFYSDILIKPNLNQNAIHSYSSETQYCGGPKYVILKRELEMYAEKMKCINEYPESLFVCFGGSDYNNITQKVINIVKKINSSFIVIIGLLYSYQDELLESIKGLDNIDVKKDVSDIGEFIYNADLALISGGTLLYETTALGTPSIVICQNNDQNDESKFFAENKAVINLGLFDQVDEDVIKSTILELISNYKMRQILSKNAKKLIDTNGADRIVKIVLTEFSQR